MVNVLAKKSAQGNKLMQNFDFLSKVCFVLLLGGLYTSVFNITKEKK